MKLPKNLGRVDRIVYIGGGLGMLIAAGVGLPGGLWRVALGLVGAVVALEGFVGF